MSSVYILNHMPSALSPFLDLRDLCNSPHFVMAIYIFGEGNGNPLQYSCLENPMDGGTWWAKVHGVAKSRTVAYLFQCHKYEPWNNYTNQSNVKKHFWKWWLKNWIYRIICGQSVTSECNYYMWAEDTSEVLINCYFLYLSRTNRIKLIPSLVTCKSLK